MNANGPTSPPLRDLWSTSELYRRLYQADDEVETIVRLLEMDRATALADVGCGNGLFAAACARANPACRIWAFDVLESAVAECRATARELNGDRFTAAVAWAHQLPLPDASVDRVLCRAVLHHVPDPRALYAEIARVLRRDGLLLLQAPCNYWQKPWGQVISDLYMFDDDSHRRQYHQPGDVISALSEAGLAMHNAACWPYPRQDLNKNEVDFIKRHGAENRFRLRQDSDGKWSCSLYWVRVIATRP